MARELELFNILAGTVKGQCLISFELKDSLGEKYCARVLCHTNYMEYMQKAFTRMKPIKLSAEDNKKVEKLVRGTREKPVNVEES